VHSKYVGTGNADTTREEWLHTQHRDTYSLIIGMNSLYVAAALGEGTARVRHTMIKVHNFSLIDMLGNDRSFEARRSGASLHT